MRRHFFFLPLAFALLLPAIADASEQQPTAAPVRTIDELWADLADADAAKAYRAIWSLAKTPEETVSFIAKHLQPSGAPDHAKVERWIDDLGSDTFAVREKANLELIKLAGLAEPNLRKALKANPSLEKGRRLTSLVNRLAGPITLGDQLRAVRAVETLERIGSDRAKNLLTTYAAGAVGARLTQDAKETLVRWQDVEPATFKLPAARTDLYGDALPVGAAGRLGTVRFRRNMSFQTFAFLPGGKALVSSGEGYGIQIWDYPSGRLLHEISTEALYIRGFALAPDGKCIAVGGFYPFAPNLHGPEIRVLDLPSGKLIKSFSRKAGDTFQLAFSPDGKLLFSLSNGDGLFRVDDIASGNEIAQQNAKLARTMAVSKDGNLIALADSSTGKLYLWKWRDQKPRELSLPVDRVDRLGFSPDAKVLVAIEGFGSMVGVDVANGNLLYRHDYSGSEFSFMGRPVFTPDGKTMAVTLRARRSVFRGKLQFFDPATGQVQDTLETGTVGGALDFTSDSRTLAMTSGCGMRFWDVPTRREIEPIGEAHNSSASNIIVPGNGLVVTSSDDGSVRIWDAATSKQRWKFTAEHWVRGLAFSPNGRLVAALSMDDVLHVLDARTRREIYRLPGHGESGMRRLLRFSSDSQTLISWGSDYFLRIWDMKTGKARLEYAIRPKGIDFPKAEDARQRKFDETELVDAAITQDCGTLVLFVARHYHLFDVVTGKETFMFPNEIGNINAFAISPDGKYAITTSSGDGAVGKHSVLVTDLKSGATIQRLLLPGLYAEAVTFAPDGRSYATTVFTNRGEITLFETASGKERATIRGFRGRVSTLTFFPDCRRLASGQNDSTVVIWDLATPEFTK